MSIDGTRLGDNPETSRRLRDEEAEACAKIAECLRQLPADECNVPFDSEVQAGITGRSHAAQSIAAAIRARITARAKETGT